MFVGSAGGPNLTVDLWPALLANLSPSGVFMGTESDIPSVYRSAAAILGQTA